MSRLRNLLAAACATTAAVLAFAAPGTAVAVPSSDQMSSVPVERTRPAVGIEAVSCGYYSGTTNTVYGHQGNRVREAQCLLVYWGYSVGPKGIDGDFGSATLAAVKAFQRDTYAVCGPPGLVDDGEVGRKTWSALRADNSCPTE